MRFKLLIAYDGTDFLGFQSQSGGQTVQDAIEASLLSVFKKPIRLHGASRTDSGVHALGQAAHFDAEWTHGCEKLLLALQTGLPKSIVIRELIPVNENFHARFSAKGKRYTYTLKLGKALPFETRYLWEYPYKINFLLLKKALKAFVGSHNFSAFAGAVNKEETPIKTLKKCTASKKGDVIVITLVGSGFLYKMARSIVGFALEIARGKADCKKIAHYLKNPHRNPEIVTAPALGLRLEEVFYPIAPKAKKR